MSRQGWRTARVRDVPEAARAEDPCFATDRTNLIGSQIKVRQLYSGDYEDAEYGWIWLRHWLSFLDKPKVVKISKRAFRELAKS